MRGRGWQMTAAGVLVLLAVASTPASATSISVTAPPGSIAVGGTKTVTLEMDAVPGAGGGLFGFGFRIAYDGTGLSATVPTIDALWTGSSARVNNVGNTGATANLLGSASGPSGSGIPLATLVFEALAPGTYQLTLNPYTGPGDNVLFDGTVLDAAGSGLFAQTLTIRVPEPTAGVLVLAALLGAARLARGRWPA